MGYKFTDAGRYPYEPGGFFLGVDDDGREVGILSDRHLITVAGARSGKGAALIVPNLKRWPGACVVVDPKGENATITAGERKAMGQTVGVVDPYRIASSDAAGLRCSINPLSLLDPETLSIRADLEALGDGLIRRFDAKHAQWDNAAASICAGVADFVLAVAPPEERTLLSVRGLLLTPDDDLKAVAQQMAETATAAGLAKQAGVLILNKFSNPEGVPASAFNRAIEETGWIDDPAFASILGGDDLPAFDLATLKDGTGSLYLCIPPRLLTVRGGFLRVFVSMGLHVMASDLAGHDSGARCLFLLDEFHSLGKLDLVAKASGLMPGYGVHLWPFLQDLGQLEGLYGPNEMHTFFANADAHIFFGNADKPTLDYVSGRLGHITPDEIGAAPVGMGMALPITGAAVGAMVSEHGNRATGAMVGGAVGFAGALVNAAIQAEQQAEMNKYQQQAMTVGKARVPPDVVRAIVGKYDGEAVAVSMIVFAKGGDVLNVPLAPYFAPPPIRPPSAPSASAHKAAGVPSWGMVLLSAAFIGAMGAMKATAPGDDPMAAAIAFGAIGFAGAWLWRAYKIRRAKAG